MTKEGWLKKYTDIKHLKGILKRNSLFLGDPDAWPDKNDVYAIKLAHPSGARVTCMTMSADRYHFWTDYGGGLNGVCLWFNPQKFKRHVKGDNSLIAGEVVYPPMNREKTELTFGKMKPASSAFVKRQQYADEREFRVIRSGSDADTDLSFSKPSLERIYLNSWLEKCCADRMRKEIQDQLNDLKGYEHVKIKQNRVCDHKDWKDALEKSFEKQGG